MDGWKVAIVILIFALVWTQIIMDYRKKLLRIIPRLREVEGHKQAFRGRIADVETSANDFTGSLEIIYNEIERLEEQRRELQKTVNPLGMICIPAGKFRMGNKEISSDRVGESPEHEVRLQAFYIDQYEVTNQHYKYFVDATGHRQPAHWFNGTFPNTNMADHPIVNVSWEDATAFAEKQQVKRNRLKVGEILRSL